MENVADFVYPFNAVPDACEAQMHREDASPGKDNRMGPRRSTRGHVDGRNVRMGMIREEAEAHLFR